MKHVVADLTTGKIIKMVDIPPDVDPQEHMRQQMDDCPLCKEARARGEVPRVYDREMVQALIEDVVPRRRDMRRPRWRNLKRYVR